MFDNGPSATLSVFSDPQTGGRTIAASDGEVFYQPHTPADSVFFIQRGQVRVYAVGADHASSRLIEILGAGQWFGAAALAGLATHQLRAVAVGSATVIGSQCTEPGGRPVAQSFATSSN